MSNDSRRSPYQRRRSALIQAVGRLYNSHPGVRVFTMRRDKDGVIRARGYKWYRESWMDEILNAYRNLRGQR